MHRLSLKSVISARTSMSTIGLLALTEKTLKLGRIHMRPFSMLSQDSLEIFYASGHTDTLESEDDITWEMVVRPLKCATRRVCPPKGT